MAIRLLSRSYRKFFIELKGIFIFKSMKEPFRIALSNAIRDSKETILNFQHSLDFVKEHELWHGILKYTWLSKFLMLVGVIGVIGFVRFIFTYWTDNQVLNELSLASLGSAVGGFFVEGYDLFVLGGLKYVILILMEVIIFHFARRTLEIKTGVDIDTSLKSFIDAQIRMIKVVIYSWLMETIATVIIVKIILSFFGIDFMDTIATVLIQSYFLGFAIIDNYNEIYHMTIKQSLRYDNQYAMVTLIIGTSAYVMMLVPLAGTIVGPLICAVVATLTMHQLYVTDQNMAWIFETHEDQD